MENLTGETEADIVRELRPGHFVWFAKDGVEGFREVSTLEPWTADRIKDAYNWDLARDWVMVTYTDGFEEDRPRYGTHEIWKSGARPMVGHDCDRSSQTEIYMSDCRYGCKVFRCSGCSAERIIHSATYGCRVGA